MHEWVGLWPNNLVGADVTLDREFEERLRDSSSLAFNVAYGVLRNRADAEEVAQDAFVRAFRRFHQLRDRDRFRAWLNGRYIGELLLEADMDPSGVVRMKRKPNPSGLMARSASNS